MSAITEYRIEYVGDDGELYEAYRYDNDFTQGIGGPIYRVFAQEWGKVDGEVAKVGDERMFLDFSERHPEVAS